ncbi:MAG TPA: minor capsid protein, partial [Coriobacteriia bacterium]|nr:minor capsid protein [Coriobacteriia bacterium]
MTAVYESRVVKAIRGFKAELRAHEGVQINLMASKYLDVERALESNIAALSEQIARLASEGMEPSWSQLYRLERWQTLQLQTMEELARFNGWAVDVIKAEQLDMMTRGIDNASAALESMKPGLGQFTKMPHDALQGMVGIARDGSPLGDLLAASYPAMRDSMTRELVRSVALGRNPRVTAAAVRKATGMGLNRALTIARTEQLRVYREATRESYKAAGVTQYQRIAAQDERTCIGCAVADGEIIRIESEFDEHCNGRCDLLPIIPGVENPTAEGYKEWFDKQPAETQASILGPGRYEALKSGSASWSDLATHVSDPKWGGAWVPSNVSSLAGVKGADVVKAAESVAAKAAEGFSDLKTLAEAAEYAKSLGFNNASVAVRGVSEARATNAVNRVLSVLTDARRDGASMPSELRVTNQPKSSTVAGYGQALLRPGVAGDAFSDNFTINVGSKYWANPGAVAESQKSSG